MCTKFHHSKYLQTPFGYHNVWPGRKCCNFLLFTYKQIGLQTNNTFMHTGSWISIFVQSFIFVPYMVFQIRLSKLNDDKKTNFIE